MLKLLSDKVAIEPIFDKEKVGSLYVPDQAKRRCKQGIVKAIGRKVTTVKMGDYVFFPAYSGTVFLIEKEYSIILPEDALTAIHIPQDVDVSGLYFRDREGEYWTATRSQALYFISLSSEPIPIKDVQEELRRNRKFADAKPGRLFLIKDQEHEMSGNCFCREQALEYNQGRCIKCNSRLHYYQNPLNQIRMYHCENMKCKWNTEEANA
jgi:co-chaperonin GroES (HSP10)